MKSNVKGSDKVLKALRKVLEENPKVAQASLIDTADKILELSTQEVPLDEGTLLRSATVVEKGKVVQVGYNTEYAAKLHFHPEYRFQNGRKAFYLTDPVKRNKQNLLQFFNERVWSRIKNLL